MNSTAASVIEKLGISPVAIANRGLRAYREAACLVVAEMGEDGRAHCLTPAAAAAWQDLKSAALRDGVSLFIVSGFRSVSRQTEIIQGKLAAGQSIEDITTVCAPPGFSEHHTGCAVDLSAPGSPALETAFEETPAFEWLVQHAGRFGFHLSFPNGNRWGYQYEPWHWCFGEVQPEECQMTTCSHIVLMASYNEWMNEKLYQAAGRLSPQELAADRKAFFGSILGTLNHIVVADTAWLKRFATHPAGYGSLDPVRELPAPVSLDQIVFADFGALLAHRKMLDEAIRRWAAELEEVDLAHVLHYANMKGIAAQRRFGSLIMHFFNHQTHHRGQATALLHQAGQDVGVTDLLALIQNDAAA